MKKMHLPGRIILRDTTLREGLDVPGVEKRLKLSDRLILARAIFSLGIREFDIVHPGRVHEKSIWLARELKRLYGNRIIIHGAAYAFNARLREELMLMANWVDDIDLVIPLIRAREPHTHKQKVRATLRGLKELQRMGKQGGVGFANASQCERGFLIAFSKTVADAGADKIIIYDSVGLWDPLETYKLMRDVSTAVPHTPLLFHCHNDLGLAVANSVAAAYAGAKYLDASMNGLGDRAGNAALEQLATLFHIKKVTTGITLRKLRAVSDLVEKLTGIKKAVNHPIVGDPKILFSHISPKHLTDRKAFEILPRELRAVRR